MSALNGTQILRLTKNGIYPRKNFYALGDATITCSTLLHKRDTSAAIRPIEKREMSGKKLSRVRRRLAAPPSFKNNFYRYVL